MQTYGRLRPDDPRTGKALKTIGETVRDIPAHRLVAPDAVTWAEAGILGGLLFRPGCHAAGAERKCINETFIYLRGRRNGWPAVTGNICDFDFLDQLVPERGGSTQNSW